MKGVDGLTFEAARYRLTELIGVEAERFAFLSESTKLTDNERKKYDAIINLVNGKYSMDVDVLISSLQTLSQLLYKHYDQKVIILIDEYDVPLDKAFQHGILLGILKSNPAWAVKSNRESGDGFADIIVKPKNPDTGIIIELKYARSIHDLDNACERALEQIKERRYEEDLREEDRNDILAYGIAFYKKRCRVAVEKR